MTELEKHLLSALDQLQKDFNEREVSLRNFFTQHLSSLEERNSHLLKQVQTLTQHVTELNKSYEQVKEILEREYGS